MKCKWSSKINNELICNHEADDSGYCIFHKKHKTKEENKEAIQFLHDLVANKETPVDQIADKYDQMNPKINDGKYGCWFMWGLGTDYAKADMLGADKIHMAMVPDFSGNGERAIFTDSWNYVLNSASKNKDAAIKFLQYMADEGGMEASYKAFDRYPARKKPPYNLRGYIG